MARFSDVFNPKNQTIIGTFTAGDLEVDATTLSIDATNDRVGMGLIDPDSKLEVLATTTQQKWSYDADSFATLTVADASHTTIATGESGDLILDAADDVILDSYAGKWRFMRNGTLTNMVSATAADGSKMVFDNQVSDAGYDFKCSDGGSGITALAIDAANAGLVKLNSSLSMKEASAAQTGTAAYGQLWVKTATPNQLYFTTDAGDDIQLTSGAAMAFVGDITGVTAGVGLSGGGTTGALTLTLDLSELSAVTPTATDSFATLDSDGAVEQRTTITALSTLQAGTGLTASSGVIGVDAAQTQITSVGTIGTGTWQGTAVALGYGGTGLVGATDGKIVIADGAGAPVLLDVGSSTAITVLGTVATGTWQGTAVANSYVAALPTSKVTSGTFADARIAESNVTQHQAAITATGTIASGTWQGTAVASAYLDADTAHLSGAQTFTGTKTLNSFKGTGATTVTNILDEDAMGTNSATALATQQSIKAYADTKSVLAGSSSITTVGTVGTGTWQGTAVASAYLDADTAHLSGAQTFTGTKTLNSFKGTGSVTVTNILDEDAMGSDSATALATQQSIKAYVTANAGTASNTADLILHMQVFS